MTGPSREHPGRKDNVHFIAEWGLIALVTLWTLGVAFAVAAGFAFAPEVLTCSARYAFLAVIAGGAQLGGLVVAIGISKLVPHWSKLFVVSLTLAVGIGWNIANALINAVLANYPNWATLLQLVIGVPWVLGLGGWLVTRVRRQNFSTSWASMGLGRAGSIGWALAAAAVVLWPWVLVGSLGDWRQSFSIAFYSAVGGMLTEWLWRGLALSLLLTVIKRRWVAGMLGVLFYLVFKASAFIMAGNLWGFMHLISHLSLALLTTELWARAGKDRQGVWGAAVFHGLYLGIPALFVDTRPDTELGHTIAQLYIPIATGALALSLFTIRKLWNRLFEPLSSTRMNRAIRSTTIAAIPWTLALGAYLTFGAPGFANDGYLIILKEQVHLLESADNDELYTQLVETAESSQGEIRNELDKMGVSYRPYYLVNMIRVDGTTRGMDDFAHRPDVELVLLNPNMREYPIRWKWPYSSPDEPIDTPWGIDSIDADKVWELGITGEGIIVAGQDTGYDWEHPELKDSYRGWDGIKVDHDTNWHDAWDHRPVAFDDDSHGTHTIGTIVGNNIGIAPDARWIGCRNMRYGIGNPGSYVECMEFFFAPYPAGGDPFHDGDPALAPHIINNSWGCPPEEGCICPEPIRRAVKVLRTAGILMVVSAGNEGPGCSTVWIPASEDAVIAVGATDELGKVVNFSSRGPSPQGIIKPDVAAPGIDIISSVPGGGYGIAGGTSMAGPHVAGAAALLWSANPNLIGDIDRTEQIIVQTARHKQVFLLCPIQGSPCACGQDVGGRVPNNVYGYGVIDAYAAVQNILKEREP